MAPRPRKDRLDLWMNGIRVGYWEVRRGVGHLVYLPEWVDDEQGRPLSLSLPFTPGNQPHQGAVVTDYFDNLLPDSPTIRRRIARRYRLRSTDPFELLASIGRDCVGFPTDVAEAIFTGMRAQSWRLAGGRIAFLPANMEMRMR